MKKILALILSLFAASAWATGIAPVLNPSSGGMGVFTPQMYSSSAGSGADDATAIQAAVNAAVAAGGGTVFFPHPSSGSYNVCSGNISLSTSAPAAPITFLGTESGGSPVRTMPGCASPPTQVFFVNAWDGTTQSHGRVSFKDMRIDGYCLSKYGIFDNSSVGLTMRNSVVRNAAPVAGSSNFYQQSGYETDIDFSNRFENINDTGHACYSAGTFPDYNLTTLGTDSHLWPVAVGARIANYYQARGGNNDFSRAHGWGYGSVNGDSQPDSRPLYTYRILGSATLIGSVADSFLTSGFYINGTTTSAFNDIYGGQIIGARCMAGGAGSQCIEVDNTSNVVKNWIIKDNDTQGIGSPSIKVDSGTLDPSNVVNGNLASGVGTAPVFDSPGAAAQEIGLTLDNPNTSTYATSILAIKANGNYRAGIIGQQSGSSSSGYLIMQYSNNGSLTEGLRVGTSGLYFGGSAILLGAYAMPTISSGFCTSPTAPAGNGTWSFYFNIGSSCATSSGVLSMPSAAHGWSCNPKDVTAGATNNVQQTGKATNSVTFTNFSRTTGVAVNFGSGDTIEVDCLAN